MLALSWAVSNPPFAAPDEPAHYLRALAVGGLSLAGDTEVDVPLACGPRATRPATSSSPRNLLRASTPWPARTETCPLSPRPASTRRWGTCSLEPWRDDSPIRRMPSAPGAWQLSPSRRSSSSSRHCCWFARGGFPVVARAGRRRDADGDLRGLDAQQQRSRDCGRPDLRRCDHQAGAAGRTRALGLGRRGCERWCFLAVARTTGILWMTFGVVLFCILVGRSGLRETARVDRRPLIGVVAVLITAAAANRAWEAAYGVDVSRRARSRIHGETRSERRSRGWTDSRPSRSASSGGSIRRLPKPAVLLWLGIGVAIVERRARLVGLPRSRLRFSRHSGCQWESPSFCRPPLRGRGSSEATYRHAT